MLNNLPCYKISIDDEYSDGEDLGIEKIAFTSTPAIITKGFAFSATEQSKQLYFADKIKNRIVAPAMIPMQIYRADETGEYYVEFTEQEIEKIYSKFMKNFTNRQLFNLEHDNTQPVPAYVLESWIVTDPIKDKAFSTYGIQVPQGTVMITAQITNPQTYQSLIENEETGFSIEGFLGLSLSEIINNKKLKEQKMSEQKMSLPAGKYTMGNQEFTVLEDGTFTVNDIALADTTADGKGVGVPPTSTGDTKTAVTSADTKTAMAGDIPTPATPTLPTAPTDNGGTYSKDEIDAKFDEIMQIIAQMQAEDEAEDAASGVNEAPIVNYTAAKFSEDVNYKINRINAYLKK